MPQDHPIRVECRNCSFTRIVYPEDDVLAAGVAVEHGREMDHKLDLKRFDDERDVLTV